MGPTAIPPLWSRHTHVSTCGGHVEVGAPLEAAEAPVHVGVRRRRIGSQGWRNVIISLFCVAKSPKTVVERASPGRGSCSRSCSQKWKIESGFFNTYSSPPPLHPRLPLREGQVLRWSLMFSKFRVAKRNAGEDDDETPGLLLVSRNSVSSSPTKRYHRAFTFYKMCGARLMLGLSPRLCRHRVGRPIHDQKCAGCVKDRQSVRQRRLSWLMEVYFSRVVAEVHEMYCP
jgi:hypothetical protein